MHNVLVIAYSISKTGAYFNINIGNVNTPGSYGDSFFYPSHIICCENIIVKPFKIIYLWMDEKETEKQNDEMNNNFDCQRKNDEMNKINLKTILIT
jgi:hypothetical protein